MTNIHQVHSENISIVQMFIQEKQATDSWNWLHINCFQCSWSRLCFYRIRKKIFRSFILNAFKYLKLRKFNFITSYSSVKKEKKNRIELYSPRMILFQCKNFGFSTWNIILFNIKTHKKCSVLLVSFIYVNFSKVWYKTIRFWVS